MAFFDEMPEAVRRLLEVQFVTGYASLTQAGMPIDSPLVVFIGDGGRTLDMATGLAYPAKAERARRNPKVGLLIEGGPDDPVISVAGMAAVRDADLQANMDRYLSEVLTIPMFDPKIIDYETITRHAVWYFTRMLIQVSPAHIRWWPNPAAMDQAPQSWRAPKGATFPVSDPAPGGKPSEAPGWPQVPWPELAREALGRGAAGHMTLCDDEGFPLPIRVGEITLSGDTFRVVAPKAAPWRAGKACLSFEGREVFVGEARRDGDAWSLKVERALPVLPLTSDPTEVLQPTPETKAVLMSRLIHETFRRGQPIPKMPPHPPQPTAGAKKRAEAALLYTQARPEVPGA
jgi:hypothetical protein